MLATKELVMANDIRSRELLALAKKLQLQMLLFSSMDQQAPEKKLSQIISTIIAQDQNFHL
jgi:AICAR transformylase/IMP cyclohydrolase PurH